MAAKYQRWRREGAGEAWAKDGEPLPGDFVDREPDTWSGIQVCDAHTAPGETTRIWVPLGGDGLRGFSEIIEPKPEPPPGP